ncbi:MAG: replication-associated recombination protein A [Clostridia bacterium]|nr:replication-associated recombination protein A [Clostridia bacterium]
MEQTGLFDSPAAEPLAARVRPTDLDGFFGQGHLLGPGKILRRLIEEDRVPSMVLWGPPGVGKTTLARIIAGKTHSRFVDFSAVTSGIREVRQVMEEAGRARRFGERTILFVDEIHRFNKAQQDAFLPYVENGTVTLIGATTENPSFEVNSALLSRCRVFVFRALETDDIERLLDRTLSDPRAFPDRRVVLTKEARRALAVFSNGDARTALSVLEMAADLQEEKDGAVTVDEAALRECTGRKSVLYDKKGEEHYNLISALHKSMRNSDPDAAVYYLARMLEGGEDPLYIARRVARFAAEDVGMADPRALEIGVAAFQACHMIGMPECGVHLTEAVVYMSLAPKSNALYAAYENARSDAANTLAEPVPLQIRNAPTRLMAEIGYGRGYQYAHDTEEKLTAMSCLPDSMAGKRYYLPTDQGLEAKYGARLEEILAWKKAHGGK